MLDSISLPSKKINHYPSVVFSEKLRRHQTPTRYDGLQRPKCKRGPRTLHDFVECLAEDRDN
uniref:Uncharacterized protein n=1 Tax=Glossina palpalis gambiensis TaxID=67801 RepID=A0A1B0AZZ8_9MUSC